MSSIVIAYEDDYHEELHLLVKALRRDRGLPGLVLEGRPVRGTGNFVHEAPSLLRLPLKQTKLPPDRVVCLADADRPQNLVPGAPSPPLEADSIAVRCRKSRPRRSSASRRARLARPCRASAASASASASRCGQRAR